MPSGYLVLEQITTALGQDDFDVPAVQQGFNPRDILPVLTAQNVATMQRDAEQGVVLRRFKRPAVSH